MKIQQRNFIVEIKSNGRRAAVRQGSIWGSTDLKALARQAASVAPQLFDDATNATSIVDVDDVPPTTSELSTQPGISKASCATDNGLELLIAPAVDHSMEIEAEKSVSASGSDATKYKSAIVTKRKGKNAIERRARDTNTDKPVTVEPIDELSALEAENRDLRAQLARHLRTQNQQLHQMLKRLELL